MMYRFMILPLLLFVLVGAGCSNTVSNTNVPQVENTTINDNGSAQIANYVANYIVPNGASTVTIASENGTTNRIVTDKTFEQLTGNFESTYTAVTLRVLENSTQLSPEEWAKQNISIIGSYSEKAVTSVIIDNKSAISFMSGGYSYEKTILIPSTDKRSIVLVSYDEEIPDIKILAEKILGTLKIK